MKHSKKLFMIQGFTLGCWQQEKAIKAVGQLNSTNGKQGKGDDDAQKIVYVVITDH